MRVTVSSTDQVLAEKVTRAKTARERLRGLLGRPPLASGEALVIEPASQVHTLGMKYPIDVLFCTRDGTVRHIVRAMRPNRITRPVLRARVVIEMPSGVVPEGLQPGDRIEIYGG